MATPEVDPTESWMRVSIAILTFVLDAVIGGHQDWYKGEPGGP